MDSGAPKLGGNAVQRSNHLFDLILWAAAFLCIIGVLLLPFHPGYGLLCIAAGGVLITMPEVTG